MKSEKLLRAILPDVLIDNFDVVNFEKTDVRFDITRNPLKISGFHFDGAEREGFKLMVS